MAFENFKETINDIEYSVSFTKAGSHTWHPSNTIRIEDSSNRTLLVFNVNELPSGCGSVSIYNINAAFGLNKKEDMFILLKRIFNLFKQNGVGSIITTYGQGYFHSSGYKLLIDYGFKIIVSYLNHRHGSGYKQHLLQLTI